MRTYTIQEIIGCIGLKVFSNKYRKTYAVIHLTWQGDDNLVESEGIIKEVILLDLQRQRTRKVNYKDFVHMVNIEQLVISYFEPEDHA